MAILPSSGLLQLLLIVGAAGICFKLFTRIQHNSRRRAFIQQHKCEPPASIYPLPWWDLIGIRFVKEVVPAARRQEMLPCFASLHEKYGVTYCLEPPLGRRTVLSDDAENVKCMMSTKFDDWVAAEVRQEGVGALLGDGIFTTDGAFWAHSRALMRPQFEKSQVSEQVDQFEKHLPRLFTMIKDGEFFDLQKLFHRFTMDTSTEFLTGESTNSLDPSQSEEAQNFIDAFDYAMDDSTMRIRLGLLYYLKPDFKAMRDIKYCRAFVEKWVKRAIEFRDSSLAGSDKVNKSDGPYIFINELAKQKEVDATRIHNETMNVLLAGRDTTASLLSHLWFELSRRPDVWEKLQKEVDKLQCALPSYEQLKDMRYLRDCVRETLRLYPPLPVSSKRAACDTVLPHGGGPNGDKPLFVGKGTTFTPSFWGLQRSKDVYGPDADDFRPERWQEASLRPYWSYLPFGGGPRACLGQNYASSETYYVTVRLMQHFRGIKPQDTNPWKGRVAPTLSIAGGLNVALRRESSE